MGGTGQKWSDYSLVQNIVVAKACYNVSMGKWQFLRQSRHTYLPYSKNPHVRTTILRTSRLKFSVTYRLKIRCSFKQEPYLSLKFKVLIYEFLLYYPMNKKMQWPEHNHFMGWDKMSQVGQNRSLEIFICMLKIRRPMVMRSSFLIFPLA